MDDKGELTRCPYYPIRCTVKPQFVYWNKTVLKEILDFEERTQFHNPTGTSSKSCGLLHQIYN